MNAPTSNYLGDAFGRPLRDIRISVTDRCNFRCPYCMPAELYGEEYTFLPRSEILTFEEIERLARIFVDLGVAKIRLTGGEPLVRAHVTDLVERIANIDPGLDLTLTTNGALLAPAAQDWPRPGCGAHGQPRQPRPRRLHPDVRARQRRPRRRARRHRGRGGRRAHPGQDQLRRPAGGQRPHDRRPRPPLPGDGPHRPLHRVHGRRHPQRVGSEPGRDRGRDRRPLSAEVPLEPIGANYVGEVAKRWRYTDGSGEIGIISSVSQPFCGDCSRARLSTEGKPSPACSPPTASTCGARCATAPPTTS